MSDSTNTNIGIGDKTQELIGYCPSIADPLVDGEYDLSELNLSFEEACKKLELFRESLAKKKKLNDGP